MWILSPWFLAGLSTLIGILFTFIPPNIYESVIREKNYMYMNTKLFLFVFLCMIMYILGSKIFFKLFFNKRIIIYKRVNSVNKYISILSITIILFFVLLINLISLLNLVLRFNIFELLAFSNINGRELRVLVGEVTSGGMLGWVRPLSSALLLWSYWAILNTKRKTGINTLFFLTVLIFLMNIFLSLTRGPFFNFIIMMTSILFLFKSTQNKLTKLFLLRIGVILICVSLFIFIILQVIRFSGTYTEFTISEVLMGYFPASYNRLAAIVEGQLIMPNSNTAYYTTQFIWDFPFLSRSLELYELGTNLGLDLPLSANDNWSNQFWAVEIAGLNHNYIWATIFGFVFSDFGWISPIWFLIYGGFSGFVYSQFLRGNAVGIILYPYFIFSIARWVSTVQIATRDIIIYAFAILLVYLVKEVFSPPNRQKVQRQ